MQTLQSTPPALPTSQSSTSQSSSISLSAAVGGAIAAMVLFIIAISIIIIVLVVILYRRLQKGYQRLLDKETESDVEAFQDHLHELYVGLRSPSPAEAQVAAGALVRKVKSSDANKDHIKEAIMNILETIDLNNHENFLKVLKYTKDIFPDLSGTSQTLERMRNGLIQTLEGSGGNGSESMKRAFEELKDTIKRTPPEYIKKMLLRVCEKLNEELIEREKKSYKLGQKEQQEAQTEQNATATESEATMTNSNPGPMEGHNSIAMHPINSKLADGNTSYV